MKNDISEESYQKLKKILEKQNHTTYTMEEIREIGTELIEFYEALAEPSAEEPDEGDLITQVVL